MMLPLLLSQAIAPLPAAAPDCRPSAIVLTLDGKDGDFDGMSHSGTLLVLRNRGREACRLSGLPSIAMLDRRGRALPAARRAPPGMHPGPVMVPVTVTPGAAVSTPLRWVSGPVFAASRCLSPARVSVAWGGGRVSAPIRATMCGEAGKPVFFDQPPLAAGTGS